MKGHRRVYGGVLLSLAVLLILGVLMARADDKGRTVEVDCTDGRSIAHALDRGNEDRPLVVTIRGICNENVVIDRDDVTLRGASSSDGVTGLDPTKDTILVDGARRVVIENLTVSGGGNGITFARGSSGTMDGCAVQNTGGHGVRIEGGGATVINSTISSNHVAGIMLEDGGSGRIGITNANQYAGNTISGNGGDGIHLQYGATASIGGNTISGNGTDPNTVIDRAGITLYHATVVVVGNNQIKGNQGAGIIARSSSLRIGDISFGLPTANTISGNGLATTDGGVFAFVGTALDIRDATISGNTGEGVTGQGSSLRIRNSIISGNAGQGVQAFLGTSFDIRNTTVTGNTGRPGSPGIGVLLTTRSVGRMRGSIIQNNSDDGIRLAFGSGFGFDFVPSAPNTVTGNAGFGVNCTDGESSVTNTLLPILILTPPDNLSGGVSGTCTGY